MTNRLTRTAVLSATAFLLAAVPAAQVSAAPATNAVRTVSASPTAATVAPRPALSARATVKSIRAWQQFRVLGTGSHMRAGTRVTLQQLQRRGWVSLPIHMNTNRNGSYDLRVKLGIKGANKIRIVGGGAVSPTVTVTIR
ncbi:hypothetical protein [Streptomyces beijiangensis]|uniref:Secreted protein n=1 Tax=Streptomyces beijiangensis TaxID=163361 RepID=A0A939JG34_9ACTN|nr:hypothetical protein [Streptomyces beijiangensis]MBO0514771.1 hypothetical protein [Streptomyces beijiangensis]